MIKSTPAGKVGGNYPQPTPVPDTSRLPVGGQMPTPEPLPTMADVPGYLGGPA